jgi:anaerobic ribonucleoside-triphosphate reductase activating protein
VIAAEIISLIEANPLCMGVTLTGGEPLCQAKELIPLCLWCKERGLSIALYSGYTFEEIMNLGEHERTMLSLCDILIDGRFELGKRSLSLKFRGSSNQRIIDLPLSIKEGRVIITEDPKWANSF